MGVINCAPRHGYIISTPMNARPTLNSWGIARGPRVFTYINDVNDHTSWPLFVPLTRSMYQSLTKRNFFRGLQKKEVIKR